MRFEVKTGGMIAIFLGVAVLSGAVFMLGILAGWDMGRQNQSDTQQLATEYPLQAPSAVAATPAAQMSPSESAPVAEPAPVKMTDSGDHAKPQPAATAPPQQVAKTAMSAAARPTPASDSLPPDIAESPIAAPTPPE